MHLSSGRGRKASVPLVGLRCAVGSVPRVVLLVPVHQIAAAVDICVHCLGEAVPSHLAQAGHHGVGVVVGRRADVAGLLVLVFTMLHEAGCYDGGVALRARCDGGPAVYVPGGGISVGEDARVGMLQVQSFYFLLLSDVKLGNREGGGA